MKLTTMTLGSLAMLLLAGSTAQAAPKKKPAKTPVAKAAAKPWTAPGWIEGYVEKARKINSDFKLVPGGKTSLLFAGQRNPDKNLDPTFEMPMVEVISGGGEKMDSARYRRHDFLQIRHASGKTEVWKQNAGGTRVSTPIAATGRTLSSPSSDEFVDASSLGPGCGGVISREVHAPIWIEAGVSELRLFVTLRRAEEAASIVIASPSGELRCHSNPTGTDTVVELAKPAPGMWSVWVGRSAPDNEAGPVLFVSADRGDKFASLAKTVAERQAESADALERGQRATGNSGKSAAFRTCSARARARGNGNNSGASATLAKCMREHGY